MSHSREPELQHAERGTPKQGGNESRPLHIDDVRLVNIYDNVKLVTGNPGFTYLFGGGGGGVAGQGSAVG